MQNCSSSSGVLSSDTAATHVSENTQTANQSIASVRNQTIADNISNSIPTQKEIKGSSGSLDMSSSQTAREMKGRPIILFMQYIFTKILCLPNFLF